LIHDNSDDGTTSDGAGGVVSHAIVAACINDQRAAFECDE